MSSDVDSDMGQPQQPNSWEDLGHKMYSKDHVRFHTEITKPDGMSFLDMTVGMMDKYISKGAGKVGKTYTDDYRDNMVAYKRQRAKETESMVKANVEAEKQKANVKEMLLGLQR